MYLFLIYISIQLYYKCTTIVMKHQENINRYQCNVTAVFTLAKNDDG